LKDDKFFILYAKNGQEAVDIVRDENDIDLVLMDIKMPVMNGIDATIIIKELSGNSCKSLPQIPVKPYQ
jgi:CheY-like chemotaxis protein